MKKKKDEFYFKNLNTCVEISYQAAEFLKNVEIGYTLPKHLSMKARIENARFYVSAVNLYTFSKFSKKFWDPEVGADSYPIQTTVFLGLNLTF